ncbi:phosphoglycerate dehydrogenase [Limosilactobacillus ingluviei]|uniref:phosphoglycerate dehydrogenase n=1 Tax=Limosilactobacillus ingluviei TaxID=148604 RepID=UPI0024B886A6|nr:phosphoglycerate dehydrogenase [Limosilactobacillus ingluviei]
MYHVKTYNAIAPAGLATLSDQYRVNQPQAAPDAYMIRSVDLHEHDFPASLKVIARCGAGFNNIPLARASAAGIAVFNTPGGNANAVKELVLAMMIAANRNLIAAAEWTQQVAAGADITLEAKKSQFNGQEIAGKKLAVIGTGHVGSLVANAGEALGMEVVGYDPYLSVESAWNLSRNVHRAATLAEAVAGADFVTVHVPKNEETTGMIDAGLLAQLKPTAVLLNFARLGIVDNEAAIAALNAGRLRWYLTDFSDATIQGHPRVVILPHLGGSTVEAEANCAKLAAQELMTFLETGNVVNSVNLPNVSAPFASDHRLTLIHQNIPNMLGQISTVIANAGINIENLVNRSRGDYAYTMVDVAAMTPTAAEGLVATLGQIEAVSRIRLLHR